MLRRILQAQDVHRGNTSMAVVYCMVNPIKNSRSILKLNIIFRRHATRAFSITYAVLYERTVLYLRKFQPIHLACPILYC